MASIVPSGSHHAAAPRKYTPAQNASAVAALKFGGNNPGQRLNANSARKTTGSSLCNFSFTARQDKSSDKPGKPFKQSGFGTGMLPYRRAPQPRVLYYINLRNCSEFRPTPLGTNRANAELQTVNTISMRDGLPKSP